MGGEHRDMGLNTELGSVNEEASPAIQDPLSISLQCNHPLPRISYLCDMQRGAGPKPGRAGLFRAGLRLSRQE